jgi:hypothetical protein
MALITVHAAEPCVVVDVALRVALLVLRRHEPASPDAAGLAVVAAARTVGSDFGAHTKTMVPGGVARVRSWPPLKHVADNLACP